MEAVPASDWNRLCADNPFLRHEFLAALERNACLGEAYGWYPRHLLARDTAGRLVGAMPMYIKTNSYGEFVFDWSWAQAYGRSGLDYYPKLVVAVPYNPVPGPRLLVDDALDPGTIRPRMIEQAIAYAHKHRYSGLHWLFTPPHETGLLRDRGLMLRMDCQYHWHNNDYRDFDHFLHALVSRKRKKLRRERRRVAEQGIALHIVHGDQADEALWRQVHRLYTDTFERKAGIPTLSLGFFRELGQTLGQRVVLVRAEHRGRTVACAVNLRSDDTLYGRFWGCERAFHSLHFEACYYQGIEYCIRHGLKRFESGAQGEHKIARGFLPVATWSAHWIAHDDFRRVLADYSRREQTMMARECEALMALSPYRQGSLPPAWQASRLHPGLPCQSA
jgi:predicted N-acyltransferase